MSAITKVLPIPPNNFSTTLSSGISDSALTIPLNSVTGLPSEGVGVIYQKDANGDPVTATIEFIHWTGISSLNLTLTDSGDRGVTGSASSNQAHSSGDTFEVWIHTAYYFNVFAVVEHNTNGTHKDITADSIVTTAADLPRVVVIQAVGGTSDTAVEDGVAYFTCPVELNGYNLTAVHANVVAAGTTGTTDIQIHNLTSAADMLSTKITIDSGEVGSDTAETPAVIDTAEDDVATYNRIRIDVDAVSTTAAKGLVVSLTFKKP